MGINKYQKALGDFAENKFSYMLKDNRYFAYRTKSETGKQPVDIIAFKKGKLMLVDIKHLQADKTSFDFSRIENNQLLSLEYACKVLQIDMRDIDYRFKTKEDIIKSCEEYVLGFVIAQDVSFENTEKERYKTCIEVNTTLIDIQVNNVLKEYFLKTKTKLLKLMFIDYKIILDKVIKGEKSINLKDPRIVDIIEVL